MRYIKFNTKRFDSFLIKVILCAAIISSAFFIFSNLEFTIKVAITSYLVGFSFFASFYYSRYEPEYIKLEDNMIEIVSFNKVFFKHKLLLSPKETLCYSFDGEKIKVSIENKLIAIVRKTAIKSEDFDFLIDYFEVKQIPMD